MAKTVYILEDEFSIRSTLNYFLKQSGYEVFTFSEPSFCPLSSVETCTCNRSVPCVDFIITDINMPGMTGLQFIEIQKKKGCIVYNIAIMSATWEKDQYKKAKELGCKVFEKPFGLNNLLSWMKNCEKNAFIPIYTNGSCDRIKITK